jgi:hypothetical protein
MHGVTILSPSLTCNLNLANDSGFSCLEVPHRVKKRVDLHV